MVTQSKAQKNGLLIMKNNNSEIVLSNIAGIFFSNNRDDRITMKTTIALINVKMIVQCYYDIGLQKYRITELGLAQLIPATSL